MVGYRAHVMYPARVTTSQPASRWASHSSVLKRKSFIHQTALPVISAYLAFSAVTLVPRGTGQLVLPASLFARLSGDEFVEGSRSPSQTAESKSSICWPQTWQPMANNNRPLLPVTASSNIHQNKLAIGELEEFTTENQMMGSSRV